MTLIAAPTTRTLVPFTFVKAGEPVSASDWSRAAQAVNWAASRGRVIVPAFKPDTILDLSAGDNTWTWSLWLEPAYQAIQQVITCTYHHDTTGTTGEITAGGIGSVRIETPSRVDARDLGSQTTTGAAYDFTIDLSGFQESGYVYVDSIQGIEIPRAFLENDANERGISLSPFVSGQPVTMPRGVDALRDAVNVDTQIGRRVLLHYAEPYKTSRQPSPATEVGAGGDIITSATFTAVRGGAGSPVLARKTLRADTTRTVKCRAFARAQNGTTTGEVRFTSSVNGSSSAITLDGSVTTDFVWSSEVDLVVDCEDVTAVQGLQSSTWDEVSVEARRTAGAGNIYVAGWVVYEDGP